MHQFSLRQQTAYSQSGVVPIARLCSTPLQDLIGLRDLIGLQDLTGAYQKQYRRVLLMKWNSRTLQHLFGKHLIASSGKFSYRQVFIGA